jgi:polyhydroxybutyrate depolymerase
VPLVVVFHGGGGTARAAATQTGWHRKADRESFVAVFPEGTGRDPQAEGSFLRNPQIWHDGSGRFTSHPDADDVAFTEALLDRLSEDYPIDPARIYATGFSNGASMTFRVGAELAGRFAAVAPVAGSLWLEDPNPARPVPLCYITGAEDTLNRLEGGVPRTVGGREIGRGMPKPPVRESVEAWARALGCTLQARPIDAPEGVTALRYAPCSGGAEVLWYTVADCGHTWPGGRSLLPEGVVGPSTDALDATDVIWRFFSRHTLSAADAEGDGFVTQEEAQAIGQRERRPVEQQASAGTREGTVPEGVTKHADIAYAEIEGSDPERLSLDLYAADGAEDAPIMLNVHGGGWHRGDKSAVWRKPELFAGSGWLFASTNYRFVPEVTPADQVRDIARAIAWLHGHAADYGGDPGRIYLMGHSAGAHLVALVSTYPAALQEAGLSLSALSGTVVVDTGTLDLETHMPGIGGRDPWHAAFGEDPVFWREMSPLAHVVPDTGTPPMLMLVQGSQRRIGHVRRFTNALIACGFDAQMRVFPQHTHRSINRSIGAPGDATTEAVAAFLTGLGETVSAPD